jgi:ATP-dependent DNA ligase
MARIAQAKFIPPMLLLKADRLPDDPGRTYELKLDGYRAIAFKRDGRVLLRSRNDKDFATRYPAVVKALANLPTPGAWRRGPRPFFGGHARCGAPTANQHLQAPID